MSRAAKQSALARLDELRAAAEDARAAERARRAEMDDRARDLTDLRAALDEHDRHVGAGGGGDPEAAARAAELREPGVEVVSRSGFGRAWTEVVDRRAEARFHGAREAREAAERALAEFAAEHLDAVLVDLAAEAAPRRERVVEALAALRDALGPAREDHRRAREACRDAGRPGELGPFEFAELERALGRVDRAARGAG